ncbi:MAG: hypothetical protein K0Q77_68 [Anaerosporomusa subterranea]|jgi:uncharacterized protein YecA (UPF0149 family)|nr:hypothetical protein [Anaerosporomusa subterranea]
MTDEDKELNRELRKLQRKAKRLILSDFYDSVKLSDLQYEVLRKLTNADTHKDINTYLWNSGTIQLVLKQIEEQVNEMKKAARRDNPYD